MNADAYKAILDTLGDADLELSIAAQYATPSVLRLQTARTHLDTLRRQLAAAQTAALAADVIVEEYLEDQLIQAVAPPTPAHWARVCAALRLVAHSPPDVVADEACRQLAELRALLGDAASVCSTAASEARGRAPAAPIRLVYSDDRVHVVCGETDVDDLAAALRLAVGGAP